MDCQGHLLPDPILVDQVQIVIVPTPSRKEVEDQIRWMERHNYIAGVTPEFGGSVKWKITDAGKLAE